MIPLALAILTLTAHMNFFLNFWKFLLLSVHKEGCLLFSPFFPCKTFLVCSCVAIFNFGSYASASWRNDSSLACEIVLRLICLQSLYECVCNAFWWSLQETVGLVFPQFKGANHEDAQEFLLAVLVKFKEEVIFLIFYYLTLNLYTMK